MRLSLSPAPRTRHAGAVTVTADGAVDPDALLDLLDNPPAGVYRLKGFVTVRERSSIRTDVVNVVGPSIDISRGALSTGWPPCLVAASATAIRRSQRDVATR